jgi:hypothetical protein
MRARDWGKFAGMRAVLTHREAVARARKSSKFRRWHSRRLGLPKKKFTVDVRFKDGDNILSLVDEKHHTPAELGKSWALSAETIRRLFENEPGVLKISNASAPTGRRRYKTLRIPASVAARVHRRISA